MQPKPLYGAAAGATARGHAGFAFASLACEWDAIRGLDRTIDVDLYRRRITARRRQAHESSALTSCCMGVLALLFAAAPGRTSNHTHPAAPIGAPPIPNAADVRF